MNKSTVPVGTGKRYDIIKKKLTQELDFDVASNPEFLREGSAINDFMRPDRVVIGCKSEKAKNILKEFIDHFICWKLQLYSHNRNSRIDKICSKLFFSNKNYFY